MDNYNYEVPNHEPVSDEDNRGTKKQKKKVPGLVKAICFGLIFGLVGGLTFTGTNAVLNNVIGDKDTGKSVVETKTTDKVALDVNASGTVNTDISEIAKNVMPSVVSITNMSVSQVMDFFGGVRERESESAGSGIIISENDDELLIVTNNHVVEGNTTLTVSFIDEESVEASVKGTDSTKDLAVIAVKKDDVKASTKEEIKVATIGDSTKLQVGEPVVAIGNALGYGQSVTTGIVSATNRKLDMEGFDSELIQTDAAINPGNSGGALLNIKGELIGINTVKANDVAVEGMGYAIPISDASEVITTLMNKETREVVPEDERGSVGVSGVDVTAENAKLYNIPQGVYVSEVVKGSGAAKADIKKGSVITAIDGTSVGNYQALSEELQYYRVGDKVTLTVQVPDEDGSYSESEVEVTLGTRK
ncbi:S1C family serine protease [Ohessyouella blattaphilus]|uniref:Trypsin-like peptidase domain-containing protein n=1 Tax=Ohessyouella blattaphilus TaxID=2949333 RepID=A0ABT1EDB1_9FIRM|nr:trypsin-like peptidase domain-containing protein [Ohessyouella blattaphilus]MCP1108682.1 trypsin-like peptidase domain-containing protein [Ohessyouella blattaphilus]MCR8562076.1 trypsin-like peptidase domain-containing protein [Ohessyouella blattaphilus]